MSVSDFQSKVQDMADSVKADTRCPSTRGRSSASYRSVRGLRRRSDVARISEYRIVALVRSDRWPYHSRRANMQSPNQDITKNRFARRDGRIEDVCMHHRKYRLIVPFLLPALFLYGVFVLYPYGQAIYLSLTSWRGLPQQALGWA